jgi:hypothetical protein
MGAWRAGPERPKTSFCWDCSRQFHGRAHARIVGEDGAEHDVHKTCVRGRRVVGGSTTRAPRERDVETKGGDRG